MKNHEILSSDEIDALAKPLCDSRHHPGESPLACDSCYCEIANAEYNPTAYAVDRVSSTEGKP